MPRPQPIGGLDEPREYNGDSLWYGVNMRLDPGNLPPGWASEAINKRFREGVVEDRLGSVVVPWMNRIRPYAVAVVAVPDSYTVSLNLAAMSAHGLVVGDVITLSGFVPSALNGTFAVTGIFGVYFEIVTATVVANGLYTGTMAAGNFVAAWGTVYGQGVFRDPVTFLEYTLVASDGGVSACLANNPAVAIPLPTGETILERCTFVQCFDVVVLLRGFDHDPLVMENFSAGFTAITPSIAGAGLITIPRSLRGCFAANRLFLAREDDTLVASDVGDYTHFSLFDDFKVNEGEDDKLVTLAAWGASTVVVLKGKTVYRIDNIFGDLLDITFSVVTRRFGCVAADTVVDCGSDMLWLSQEGVASLTLTMQNEIQAAQGALAGKNRMFSQDIGPLISRIHGSHKANAFAYLWQDRYYIALPLDHAEMLGPELVFAGPAGGSGTDIPVTVGATYRYESASSSITLTNGAQSTTYSVDFVAQAATVNLVQGGFLPPTLAMTGSIRQVSAGVNTGMAVYDFQNNAWAGHDEAAGITFKMLFTATYVGRQRLFVVTNEGFIRLWEEGYADRLTTPYIHLAVTALPAAGNTLQVNGGTLVTAGGNWTFADLATAFRALWYDGAPVGYNPEATVPWTAPNTRPTATATVPATFTDVTGVLFYSTNGVLPELVITGDWATVTPYVEQEIVSTFVSRGYSNPEGELSDFHFLCLDLETWRPSVDVTLLADGVNEDLTVATALTKSRTAYYFPFDQAPYNPSNAGNDFFTGGRQDYSIVPTSSAYTFTPGANVSGGLHQAAREPWEVALSGRSARIKVVTRSGRARIQQCRLSETVDEMTAGPMAN